MIPDGVVISTKSFLFFPMRPLPIGDWKKINFFFRSASSFPTSLYCIFSFVSKFCKNTVDPKITFPSLFIFVTSITFALAIKSSISWILPSLCDCCSFAAWYSAFSLRSPCDLASAIAATISGRFFSFKKTNSSFKLWIKNQLQFLD